MRRILLITNLIFSLAFANVFGIAIKFDVGGRLYLGKYIGLQNGKIPIPNGEGTLNKSLSATPFGGGINLDLIFLTEDKIFYGMGIGTYLGFSQMDQLLGTIYMTNGQNDSFISSNNYTRVNGQAPILQNPNYHLSQALSIAQFEAALLYRFYPTRDFSVGIGPVFNVMFGKGSTDFLRSDFYTNVDNPTSEDPNHNNYKYYIKPMFGNVLYLSMLIDAQVTKFFGNFGVSFGVDLRLLFQPFTVGIGGTAGIRYRFNP